MPPAISPSYIQHNMILMRNARLLALCLFLSTLLCQLLASRIIASPLALAFAAPNSSTSSCLDLDDVDVNDCSVHSIVPPVDAVRGGCAVVLDGIRVDSKTRDVILRFLRNTSNNKGTHTKHKNLDDTFHIQGWRWHFMSLIRDSRRLERLASHVANIIREVDNNGNDSESVAAGLDTLHRAANYVINFNMAGLYRIQSGMFLSFLREYLCDNNSLRRMIDGEDGDDVTAEIDAFRIVVDAIDKYRVQSENIGRELYERAKAASLSKSSFQQKQQLLDDIIPLSKQLVDQLSAMRYIQETLIVPSIARVVPSKVQKSFNNRVLLSLGILESRLHLVGMHDAVWESGEQVEKTAFEEEIPYVARMMIERWRQSLYIPKAGALDYESS